MNRPDEPITAGTLLGSLNEKGMLHDPEEAGKQLAAGSVGGEMPIYLRILTLIGAVIATGFFFLFLAITGILDEDTILIVGLVFVAAAYGLLIAAKKNNPILHVFLSTCSFTILAVGKILFVIGLVEMFDDLFSLSSRDEIWAATLGVGLATVLTYKLFPFVLDRFISSCSFLGYFIATVIAMPDLDSSVMPVVATWIMNFFFLAYMICAGFLLLHEKVKKLYDPVAYALICTLLGLAVMQSGLMSDPKLEPILGFEIWLPNFIAGFGLLYLLSYAVGGFKKQMDSQAIVIAVGVILLAFFTNAGILLSILLMVFGRMNHRPLVSFIGWISLTGFLIYYYYQLDFTLETKSYVLLGSGGLLLGIRLILNALVTRKEQNSCV
ncbi:MAG: DUF4401 domain-containing protein [Verrucomicrobiota bacterium]|jgi:hypothetical protein|nr:DUF4401 domain-containing protein [Verrucomicrobiota bacterium]